MWPERGGVQGPPTSSCKILHRCLGKLRPGRPTKKSGPVKKNGKLVRQRQHQIWPGSHVLNLHRRRAPTRCSRARTGRPERGSTTTRTWGCAPHQGFDYNLIRKGPNDYIFLRNGQKKLVRSLEGDGEHRPSWGRLLQDKCYEYLLHVPRCIAGGTQARPTSGKTGSDQRALSRKPSSTRRATWTLGRSARRALPELAGAR